MKRVIMFGGYGHRPAETLNDFLTKHPDFVLLDVEPVKDGANNILLFCTMKVPDDVGGLRERLSEYLGFPREQDESEVDEGLEELE